jgi:RNA recognition motif-containing protein
MFESFRYLTSKVFPISRETKKCIVFFGRWCVSLTKLYVGNLPYSINDDALRSMFSSYGNVLSASIIFDRMSGRSKGFGFVELEDDGEAQKAISDMNEKEYEGRNMVVSIARPKEERPERSFRR